MKTTEKLLVEAFGTYLQHKSELGLANHDNTEAVEEESHSLQFLHEHINDLFHLKAVDLTHKTGICAAFRKVHNYKYINDTTFEEAFDKELTAQAVPHNERKEACDIVHKIIEEIEKEDRGDEKDFGFNPDLDGIIKVSNPGQDETK